MTSEATLLGAFLHDREAYDSAVEYVDPEAEFSALGSIVYASIQDYYQSDENARKCDIELIRTRTKRKYPKQQEVIDSIIQDLPPPTGTTNVVRELLEGKRLALGAELGRLLATGAAASQVNPVLEEYAVLNDESQLLDGTGSVKLLDKSFGELMKDTEDQALLIKLLPVELNRALKGGVLPGHTVVIIGRVNVGKSALAINNIAGFLRQGKRVLLVENEDLCDDVKRRIGLRLCQCSMEWAQAHPDQFDERCRERGGDNLLIPDPPPGTTAAVDRLCGTLKPDVVVVNQLRHLATNKMAESDNVVAVDRVAQHLRAIGKKRRIVMVLVGAAKEGEVGGDGEPKEKAVLQMSDSYGSRTGVPGCADVMLAIGNNKALKGQGMVAVHLCKNKRGSEEPVLYQNVNLENCVFSRGT